MNNPIELIMVSVGDVQSNKFYRMKDLGDGTFHVEYGRVGQSTITETYPINRWTSKYKEKIRKGYKDVSDLKIDSVSKDFIFDSIEVEHFFRTFSKYTKDNVSRNYTIAVGAVTKTMLDEAQLVLNELVKYPTTDEFNKCLLQLYTIFPRKMNNVRDYLIKGDEKQEKLNILISKEQDILDSLGSNVVTNTTQSDIKFGESLGIDISLETDPVNLKKIENLINPTNSSSHRIYKVFRVSNKKRTEVFNEWMDKQDSEDSKKTQLLMHGTRNPNIFSILKTGLLMRPTNAVVISGAAFNIGLYHSLHTSKSMGYVGYDPDKIFFLQNVIVGRQYKYSGWYRDNKDLSKHKMNYKDLKEIGYDSLFVLPGDGLLNSELICYTEDQSNTEYIVWFK